jgi:hypothetical protein
MVEVQLGQRVDELRLDVQCRGGVHHDRELVLLNAAIEESENGQDPDELELRFGVGDDPHQLA